MTPRLAQEDTAWRWIGAGWLLAALPSLVGVVRLLQWSEIVAQPLPVDGASMLALVLGLHIISVLGFGLLAPVQLSTFSRRQQARLHRRLGIGLWFSGVIVAVTSLILSRYYPHGPYDNQVLLVIRWLAGSWMLWSLAWGLVAIRQRRFDQHRAWMIRAYAVAMGAGTQVLTHLPWLVWPELVGETSRTLCMLAGWLINLSVAEVVIRWRSIRPRRQPARAASFRP